MAATWEGLARVHGSDKLEGHIEGEQAIFYSAVARLPFVHNVCEIGFNGGHSAAMWLSSKPNLRLYAFDLGHHTYVEPSRQYLDTEFPGMLTLTKGSSVDTVPAFAQANPGVVCDVLHIDGGHYGDIPYRDLVNMKALARNHSLVLIDDAVCNPVYCKEIHDDAWVRMKNEGGLEDWMCVGLENGWQGWCVGKYIVKE